MKPPRAKRPTVSLCMIVKDEESCLRPCLESVRDVVDEMVIVDTGSTDSTVEIATGFGARIYHHQWNDDFAGARNVALTKASGDWIFQLDADERLLPESRKEFMRCLKKKSVMCISVLIDSPLAEHKKGHLTRAHRLFRNAPGIEYSGRIHEQISPSVNALGGTEGFSNIRLYHAGYAKNEDEMKKKSRRNRRLLLKQVDEEPENGYWHFKIAQNYILDDKLLQAKSHLEKTLELGGLPSSIICSVHNNLTEIYTKTGQFDRAIKSAGKALEITPEQTTTHLLLFETYGQMRDVNGQISALEAARSVTRNSARSLDSVSVEAYVDEAAILLNLAHKYMEVRRFDDAETAYRKVLEREPERIAALKGLAECMLANERLAQAGHFFARLLQLDPGNTDALEKMGWLSIKQRDFDNAIGFYEQLLNQAPQNRPLLRRLAGLHKMAGNIDRAKQLLEVCRH